MTTVLVTLLAVVVVLVLVLAVELRRHPAPARSRVGPFRSDRGGATVDGSRPTVLVFLTTTCTTCADLWKALANGERDLPREARLLVVTKGQEVEDRSRVRRLAPRGVRVLMSTEAWGRYGVTAAPFVVCIDTLGAVFAEGAVSGWADVLAVCSARAELS